MTQDLTDRDHPMGHQPDAAPPPKLQRPMAELFISLWRAHTRLEQGGDAERTIFMVQRHVESAMQRLAEMGVELRSFEGQPYDPGMRAVAPTAFEISEDVAHETVGPTSSPAIFIRGQASAKSQAVILVPPPEEAAPEAPEAVQPEAAPEPDPKSRRKTAARKKDPAKRATTGKTRTPKTGPKQTRRKS